MQVMGNRNVFFLPQYFNSFKQFRAFDTRWLMAIRWQYSLWQLNLLMVQLNRFYSAALVKYTAISDHSAALLWKLDTEQNIILAKQNN